MPTGPKNHGTSKSCLSCRAKRKRCDLGNPCHRCMSSGTVCSGPVQGSVFVNSNGDSLKTRSHRHALQHAIAGRSYANDAQVKGTSKATVQVMNIPDGNSLPLGPYILEATIDTVLCREYYACLLEDFQQTPFASAEGQSICNGIVIHSDVATCMQVVASLASSSSKDLHCLDYAIFSLLNLYIGKMCRDNMSQVDLARRSYVTALREFRRELDGFEIDGCTEQARLIRAQKLFCLCLALILFELVDGHEWTRNLDRHVDGALEILRLAGPAILNSRTTRQAFNAFRGIAFSSAARRRLRLFLGEPEWLNTPSRTDSNQLWERLYDIALGLPQLLQRTDVMKHPLYVNGKDIKLLKDEKEELLQDYINLESQLRQWYGLQSLRGRKEYAHNSDHLHSRPSINVDLTGGQLHLATMLLELDMGFSDLLSMPWWSSNIPPLVQHSPTISELAALVESSTQHLAQQKEGRLIASVPLDTLTRYCARVSVPALVPTTSVQPTYEKEPWAIFVNPLFSFA